MYCLPCALLYDTAEGLSVDLKKLMAHKEKTVRGLTGGIEHLFKKNNVTYVKGKGVLKVRATVCHWSHRSGPTTGLHSICVVGLQCRDWGLTPVPLSSPLSTHLAEREHD